MDGLIVSADGQNRRGDIRMTTTMEHTHDDPPAARLAVRTF